MVYQVPIILTENKVTSSTSSSLVVNIEPDVGVIHACYTIICRRDCLQHIYRLFAAYIALISEHKNAFVQALM